jgi:putative NIF3 family GTP cyclohydrolase 1 type 2
MMLDDLTRELDAFFSVASWELDPAMARFVPMTYGQTDLERFFEEGFRRRFNGLMVRAAEAVEEVYCAAFPSPEIVGDVLRRTRGRGAFLFLHHPLDMEVGGIGFLPIPSDALKEMKAAGVSVYSCHAPMDCHDEIGTTASIIRALEVRVERQFARQGNGFSGRIGTLAQTHLHALVERGKRIFDVDRVEIGGADPASIDRVAIVAGSGDDVELMEEAEALGAQAFISGEWYTRTKPNDDGGKHWAEVNRAACLTYAESSKMALLGFSHAATESLVMREQMVDYFRERRLQAEALEPSDWWR